MADTIAGGAGADTLAGGAGEDLFLYTIDDLGTIVQEGAGQRQALRDGREIKRHHPAGDQRVVRRLLEREGLLGPGHQQAVSDSELVVDERGAAAPLGLAQHGEGARRQLAAVQLQHPGRVAAAAAGLRGQALTPALMRPARRASLTSVRPARASMRASSAGDAPCGTVSVTSFSPQRPSSPA